MRANTHRVGAAALLSVAVTSCSTSRTPAAGPSSTVSTAPTYTSTSEMSCARNAPLSSEIRYSVQRIGGDSWVLGTLSPTRETRLGSGNQYPEVFSLFHLRVRSVVAGRALARGRQLAVWLIGGKHGTQNTEMASESDIAASPDGGVFAEVVRATGAPGPYTIGALPADATHILLVDVGCWQPAAAARDPRIGPTPPAGRAENFVVYRSGTATTVSLRPRVIRVADLRRALAAR